MRFSQRYGHASLPESLGPEDMPDALHNSLWNLVDDWRAGLRKQEETFLRSVWRNFWKIAADRMPINHGPGGIFFRDAWQWVRDRFFGDEWFYVYDFLEFIMCYFDGDGHFAAAANAILGRELAAYRVMNRQFVQITDGEEVAALVSALSDRGPFTGVSEHLSRALSHLSHRTNPDYRNSIKESISAVEAAAKVVSGDDKATLNKALVVLEKQGKLHPCLKKGYSALYEYTNDADGIRHALMDEPNLTAADAKFFILACTSFVNYLKSLI
ncbi:hypothetical protein BCh11DRAFT_00746 [Burkholderia sp. Ch1-1]|nr:hypothetical protein BCh11DRAFT_00746 [Burkholderia sp. Ch1-1]